MLGPRLQKLWNKFSAEERQEIEKRAQELIAQKKARQARRRRRRARH